MRVKGCSMRCASPAGIPGPRSITSSSGDAPGGLESYVLCLMSEALAPHELETLQAGLRMAAGDAAVVQRDAQALQQRMVDVAALAAVRYRLAGGVLTLGS